ncbi:MAG: DUF2378 family protein [Archangiaceae bacterium]|nr:DUF2378 family protein [Archangiaceae bacterium]
MSSAAENHGFTDHNTFEGLFRRGLDLKDEAFKAELRTVGYDMDKPQLRYPTPVWRAALEVARRRLYSQFSPEQAYWELGRISVGGFFSTIKGRFVSAALPLLGLDAFVKSLPRFFSTTRPDLVIKVFPEAEPRTWKVTFFDQFPLPEFSGAIISAGVDRIAPELKVTVTRRASDGFDLRIGA